MLLTLFMARCNIEKITYCPVQKQTANTFVAIIAATNKIQPTILKTD